MLQRRVNGTLCKKGWVVKKRILLYDWNLEYVSTIRFLKYMKGTERIWLLFCFLY